MRTSISLLVLLAGCGDVSAMSRAPIVHSREEALRPTDTSSGLMWRFLPSDVVTSSGVDGGAFKVHFTKAGTNSVPTADVDDSGVPDFVEHVQEAYEAVGELYHGPLAFRRPLSDGTIVANGGDARFDVYLLDFARSADGAFRVDQCPPNAVDRCIGYVVQENDFVGYGYPSALAATRILGSHEYFHAVQAAYDNDQNVVLSEGTAVWATERFDPSTDDFEGFVDGYLSRPDRSLDSAPPGPVPAFAYGSAIFFKFLTERHDDALIRKLWEHLENGRGAPSEPADVANPTFLVQLDALLKSDYSSSFAAEFAEFTRWNLYMGPMEDSTKAWADASRYPAVAKTLVTLPHQVDGLRVFYASAQYFAAPAAGRTQVTAALTNSTLTPTNDLEDTVLWLAAVRAGRIAEVVQVTSGQTVDAAGGSVIAVVTNTRRGQVGASLSQRPGLCLGTPLEVSACVASLSGTVVDAGVVDAGVPDAGVEVPDAGAPLVDAGVLDPPPPSGCGCGMGEGAAVLCALAWLLNRSWRRS